MRPTNQTIQIPSNQKFGWFLVVVFTCSGAFFKWKLGSSWAMYLFMAAIIFAALTVTIPKLLAPLNIFWFQLGMILGRLVNPIVLGGMFFLMITPVAVFMKLMGRDELHLKKRKVGTYWCNREPIGPAPESFNNQF